MLWDLITEILAGLNAVSEDAVGIAKSLAERHVNTRIKAAMGKMPRPTGHALSTDKLPQLKNVKARLVVQEHKAQRAGSHWDFRLVYNGKAYSWVVGPSKSRIASGKTFSFEKRLTRMIRQPDHEAKYADFEGKIEQGYGAGTVRKVFDEPVLLLKSSPEEVQFTHNGTKVTLFSMNDDWGMVSSPAVDTLGVRLEKGRYVTDSDKLQRAIDSGEYYAEVKFDGSNYTFSHRRDGSVSLTSHRLSVDGSPINRIHRFFGTDKLLNGGMVPLPRNTVLQGEVWHSRGANYAAGLLNSSPLNSFINQRRHGLLNFTAWDVKRYEGKDVDSLPYEERRQLLEDISRKHGIHITSKIKVDDVGKLERFYRKSLSTQGEGLVLKHREQNYEGSNTPMVKMKAVDTVDCEILEVTKGEGRLAGVAIGALVCKCPGGGIVNVGTGMSDQLRGWFWENRDNIAGETVEVQFFQETENSLRGPVLVGPHPTKGELGLRMYADGLDPDSSRNAVYRLKSAAGWRR